MLGLERRDGRIPSTTTRRMMQRGRRGKRRGKSGSTMLSSEDGCDVKMVSALLLICAIIGLYVQLGMHGTQDITALMSPALSQFREGADSYAERTHEMGQHLPPPNQQNEVLEESEAPEPRESPLSGEEEDSVQNVEERHFQDPAESVELVYETDVSGEGPMEKFLRKGGKFPILMLACNRVNMLVETLKSLKSVRGMDMSKVMVLQHGKDKEVEKVVKDAGLYLKQNTDSSNLRGGSDGAKKIALHYKFSLQHVFAEVQEAPGVIIVEDDLFFSPDFLEYFEYNAPILERDPSTFILSAWNDNGFKERVKDKAELQRTTYFPGLGWLLPRKLYEEELRRKWPNEHWDHWLRDSRQHRGRECVFPEVPRTYHGGVSGTFMNSNMHNKLFAKIDYNTDRSFFWEAVSGADGVGPPSYARGMKENYELRVRARIAAARHINDVKDLTSASGHGADEEELVFWYSLEATEPTGGSNHFEKIGKRFGLWHEYRRAEHFGMHAFRYSDGDHVMHVMIINTSKSPYVELMPQGMAPAEARTLHSPARSVGAAPGGGGNEDQVDMQIVASERPSLSCTAICESKGMTCSEGSFEELNRCEVLQKHFPCQECEKSVGRDQPCFVIPDAPNSKNPEKCLLSSQPWDSLCSASHVLTMRLCPCLERS